MSNIIITYAAKTKTDSAKTFQLLEPTEMKTLPRIMNMTRLDRMKSEDIREKCGIQKVGEWTKRRRTEYGTGVWEECQKTAAKKGMTNKPVGIGSRGRPKNRWYDDLEETNLYV